MSSQEGPSLGKNIAPKKSKKIHFAKYDQVRCIPHLKDFSDEQKSECYYTHQELRAIRQLCIGIVSHVNKEGTSAGDGLFLRGLDQHTIEYKRSKKGICEDLYDIVYRAQQLQKVTGKDFSEQMSEQLIKISAPTVAAAHVAAISDLFSSYKGTWSNRTVPVIKEVRAKPSDKDAKKFQYATATKKILTQ